MPDRERDERTGAYLVNPYLELAKSSVGGLKKGDVDLFIPQIDEAAVSEGYKEVVGRKRESLAAKLSALKGKNTPLNIYLNGDIEGEEGKGLIAALSKQEGCSITRNPEETDMVYYFGSGKITDDSSVMAEVEKDPFRTNEKVIKLRIPFDRDNEDNALGHGDGTIFFERATNTRLTEILKPHVEYRLSLKDRLSRVIRRGLGKKIRQNVTS